MSKPETIDMAASSGYIPLNPAETAADAKIKYQGITITRPSNTMDDVVPNVTLNIQAKTEKPATITIEPDQKPPYSRIEYFDADKTGDNHRA